MDNEVEVVTEVGGELIVPGAVTVIDRPQAIEMEALCPLTEDEQHKLTVVDDVKFTEEYFEVVRADLLVIKATALLAQAANVDEVLEIRNMAARFKLYAEQARNREAEANAAKIRMRAERALGLMYASQKKATGGRPYHVDTGFTSDPLKPVTLGEAGISKRLANQMRQLGRMSTDEYAKHEDKTIQKILYPRKPQPVQTEPEVAPAKDGIALLLTLLDGLRKNIHSHTRQGLLDLQQACLDTSDAIEEIIDDIKEEGVVDGVVQDRSTVVSMERQ